MNRMLFLFLLFTIGATLIMCSGEQKQEVATEEATETEVTNTDKAVCAGGCSMEMEKSEMVAHEVDGETNYYCSEKCKEHHLSMKEKEKQKEL